MRVPPQLLSNPESALCIGPYDGTLAVRTPDLRGLHSQVSWAEAFALAYRGWIEGVCNVSGRLRYFRYLADSERPVMLPVVKPEDEYQSTSTVVAKTKLGVFREPVRSGFYSETGGPYGEPGIEMRIISYVWQFYGAHV